MKKSLKQIKANPYESMPDVKPFNQLSDEQQLKEKLFGKRGYERCRHTLRRLYDVDQAVYDDRLDCFFESHQAMRDHYVYMKEHQFKFWQKITGFFNVKQKKFNKRKSKSKSYQPALAAA